MTNVIFNNKRQKVPFGSLKAGSLFFVDIGFEGKSYLKLFIKIAPNEVKRWNAHWISYNNIGEKCFCHFNDTTLVNYVDEVRVDYEMG